MEPSRRTAFVSMLLAEDAPSRARFVGPLLVDLRAPDRMTRWRAALALGPIGGQDPAATTALVGALGDPATDVREAATRSLAQIGDAAVPELLGVLGTSTSGERALGALRSIGTPAVRGLVAALDSPDPHARWSAATALEEIGGGAVVEALVSVLASGGDEPCECAISALSHMGPGASPALIDGLGAASARMRTRCARALGGCGDPRVFMPLLAALSDTDPAVRATAAWSIGTTRDPRAFAPLVVALDDADASVRAGAAAGLGRLTDARAIPPLLAALADDDERVRARAACALGEAGDPAAVRGLVASLTLDESSAVRHQAADALGEIGAAAVLPLLDALDEDDEEARIWVVSALEAIGSDEVTTALSDADGVHRLGDADIADALGWLVDDTDECYDEDEQDGDEPVPAGVTVPRAPTDRREPR